MVPNGNNITASVQWKTALQLPTPDMPFGTPGIAPQLPHGTHKIRWIITDLCGNETACEYNFTVRDSKAPAVTCKSAAPDVEMPATGAIGVATSQYLESASDNCTPAAGLKYGLRKAGSGTGFPTAPGGAPQDSVHFACADLGPQILSKNLDFDLDAAPACVVTGQADWLRVMIRNLVDNAVRYTPAGGLVRVAVSRGDDGCLFSVSDSGPGIPAEARDLVLRRFHRLDQGNQPGSGLGLAIVARIAELHGALFRLDASDITKGLFVGVQFPIR